MHAAADYGVGAVRHWLLAFKHGGRPDLARPLARFVALSLTGPRESDAIRACPRPADLLVPVPLHHVRWVERGYDQAALLAGRLGRQGFGRVVPLLRRRRLTPPQGAPEAPTRRANVRGAFVARMSVPAGVRIWLVDDVLASGSTADACSLALKRAGATDVRILVIARA